MQFLLFHLRFSLRVFLKDKFFSALNILGLSMGIAVGIILVLILRSDLTYDQHYVKHRNIYRLASHYRIPDVDMMTGLTARELGPILKDHYPEIEELTRVTKRDLDHLLVQYADKSFYEEGIAQTDSTYFSVFDHHFLEGDVNTCLNDPNNVVLTQSMARKYFSEQPALNKLLTIDGKIKKISAVISDLPENTDLKFDILMAGLPEIRPTWKQTFENGKPIALVFWNPDSYTYMVLPDNYEPNNFYGRFQPIFDEYYAGVGEGFVDTPVLQRLAEIHFSGFEGEPSGKFTDLIALAAIGMLIVILACINYMNLSTAKAIKRSTEITMKRLSGSGRGTLIVSLIGESVLMSLISLFFAIGIAYFVIDVTSFNTLIGKHLVVDLLNDPVLLLVSFSVAAAIGVVSGIYPAFYLTDTPIIASLKGTFKTGGKALLMRKALITFQFGVSMFVVFITLFMGDQIQFARTKDLGFDKNNMLVIPMRDKATAGKIDVITNDLAADPGIKLVAASAQVVGTGIGGEQMWLEGEKGMEQKGVQSIYIGDNFIQTVGLKLVAGRGLSTGEGRRRRIHCQRVPGKDDGLGGSGYRKENDFFQARTSRDCRWRDKRFQYGFVARAY